MMIMEKQQALNDANIIRFYRANGPYKEFTNLFKREIEFEGRTFACSEYAYGYGKFRDKTIADWVMTAPAPHLVSILIHNLFAWDISEGWAAKKVDRMRQVLEAKFTQHPDLKAKLLATGDKLILEDSKMDSFWGNGKKGTGKNMLGQLLMELRTKLRIEIQ